MHTMVYDTGALLAAESHDSDFVALHRNLLRLHARPIVPVVVLAQAWRGGPQHGLSTTLKACDILPDDQWIGRAAGLVCASSGTSDVVDAIVVATAVQHQAAVVTSDAGDLTRLAESIGVKLRLFAV
jgi:hypothetical protein